jgi:uncharacterized protein YjbI with pentapeptide repeats
MCDWRPKGDSFFEPYQGCPHKTEEGREDGLCIFHIPIEEKKEGTSTANRFKEAFEELINEGCLNFRGFVFPHKFNLMIYRAFQRDGSKDEDKDVIDFSDTIFGTDIRFDGSEFLLKALFVNCVSLGNLSFFSVKFIKGIIAYNAKFMGFVDFTMSHIHDIAVFEKTKFYGGLLCTKTIFYCHVELFGAVVSEGANFYETEFHNTVDFQGIKGIKKSLQPSKLTTWLTQQEDIEKVLITEIAPPLRFSDISITKKMVFLAGVDLSDSSFYDSNLEHFSFLYSNISKAIFVGCSWGQGFENKNITSRNYKNYIRFKRSNLLFDEIILRERKKGYHPEKGYMEGDRSRNVPDMWFHHKVTIGAIKNIALQLKQSLEETKDPITAGDFHFCAMEMEREQAKKEGKNGRKRILWLYKMVNGYGERYGRTLMWLGWLVSVFTVFYAWNGDFVPADWTCREVSEAIDKGQAGPATNGFWEYLLFAFQNILPFKFGQPILIPCSLVAKALSFAETFIGSSLFALFLLALRRRFKR